MKRMSALDRILLLAAGLLAAYQVTVGIEGLGALPTLFYTAAFGTLTIAGLLLIIFGFEALDSPLVVVASAIIPLSLSVGLVLEYLPAFGTAYLVFAVLGWTAILVTRFVRPGRMAAATLSVVHGVAGLLIVGLPLFLSLRGGAPMGFVLVSVGGALIGIGGLLLAFLRMGRPVLSKEKIFNLLPGLLLATAAAFVGGFALG